MTNPLKSDYQPATEATRLPNPALLPNPFGNGDLLFVTWIFCALNVLGVGFMGAQPESLFGSAASFLAAVICGSTAMLCIAIGRLENTVRETSAAREAHADDAIVNAKGQQIGTIVRSHPEGKPAAVDMAPKTEPDGRD